MVVCNDRKVGYDVWHSVVSALVSCADEDESPVGSASSSDKGKSVKCERYAENSGFANVDGGKVLEDEVASSSGNEGSSGATSSPRTLDLRSRVAAASMRGD